MLHRVGGWSTRLPVGLAPNPVTDDMAPDVDHPVYSALPGPKARTGGGGEDIPVGWREVVDGGAGA